MALTWGDFRSPRPRCTSEAPDALGTLSVPAWAVVASAVTLSAAAPAPAGPRGHPSIRVGVSARGATHAMATIAIRDQRPCGDTWCRCLRSWPFPKGLAEYRRSALPIVTLVVGALRHLRSEAKTAIAACLCRLLTYRLPGDAIEGPNTWHCFIVRTLDSESRNLVALRSSRIRLRWRW